MTLLTEKRIRYLFFVLAFLVPVVWMGFLRCAALKNGDNSLDAYYHVGIAQHGPKTYLAKEFPWTKLSVWGKTFADKELLYHVSLDVICRIQRALGFPVTPPFHTAAMFFIMLVMASWIFAGTRLGISPPMIFSGSFLFCMMTANYLFRLMMLRPHVLSIAFFFVMIGCLAKGSFRNKMICTAVISFFYAWSYSNPHFIVLIPLAFALTSWIPSGKKVFLLPLISISVVILGILIHPQTPNYLTIWKLQSIDALFTPMLSGINLSKPTEMMSPALNWILPASALFLLAWLCILMFIRLMERVGIRKFPANASALFLLAMLFTAGTFVAMRSIEYASPFVAISLLLLYQECSKAGLSMPFSRSRWAAPAVLLALSVSLAAFSSVQYVKDGPKSEVRAIPQITAWLKKNVPPGETVINLDWSDMPQLFYYDDSHYYLWGMDPIFAYAGDPEMTLILTRTLPDGRARLTYPQDLLRAFNVRYAVLLWPRASHAEYLYRKGWNIAAEFVEKGKEEGWIFMLDEREFYAPAGSRKKTSFEQ